MWIVVKKSGSSSNKWKYAPVMDTFSVAFLVIQGKDWDNKVVKKARLSL